VKVREVIRLLERDGWFIARTRGSHRQFKHPTKRGTVTIARKPNDDLHPSEVKNILRRAEPD
jgi:predicted RNA binding protein YcfA (HicA-like mRNA interferase family)